MDNFDHISICICTYRRHTNLERLIKKLSIQETGMLFDYSIIVIDNDASGSAKGIIENLSKTLDIHIQYAIEPERSIPSARNHALSLATGNYIAIIDDDEIPPPFWLINLYRAIQMFEVDGALGPVIPYFEKRPPAWLIKGKFCERPIFRTGTILDWYHTRTGNVLLKRKVFDEHGLKFDINLRTSGSDKAFFKVAMEKGYKFIAVAEAPVYEIVPPERWKKSYYIKRSIVHGYNTYRTSIKGTSIKIQVLATLKSSLALGAYLLALPICFIIGPSWYVKCLGKGAHHLSQLLARFGIEIITKRNF